MIKQLERALEKALRDGTVRLSGTRSAAGKKVLDKATEAELEKLRREIRVGLLGFKCRIDELSKAAIDKEIFSNQVELLEERVELFRLYLDQIKQGKISENKSED